MNVQDRPVAARTEVGERTRERVLDAAASLIARRGYAATSISALSEAAGVRPASIYWAFGSKEGVLAAVITHSAATWFDAHGPEIAAALTADPWAGTRSLASLFADQPDFLRLLLVLSLERRDGDPAILDSARQVRAAVVDAVSGFFAPSVPIADAAERAVIARDLARLLVILLDGSFVAREIEGDAVAVEDDFALIADALRGALDRHLARLAASTPEETP
jgi:AcrR family transcriptional regulator